MKFLVIQRKEKCMTNMAKMLLKREWEGVVLVMIHLIFSNHSSMETLSLGEDLVDDLVVSELS